MTFQPGISGNPAGRPVGSSDKRTNLRALLEPHAEALVEKAVNMALAGDVTALKMCLDRIIPVMKSVEIKAPTEEPLYEALVKAYERGLILEKAQSSQAAS